MDLDEINFSFDDDKLDVGSDIFDSIDGDDSLGDSKTSGSSDSNGIDNSKDVESIEDDSYTDIFEEEFNEDTPKQDEQDSSEDEDSIITQIADEESSFISDTGDIVVMDNTQPDNNFKMEYIDIEKVAIVHRIRKSQAIDGLLRSIKSTGLLNPIVVAPTATDGVYVLLDGYRRMLCCARAGIRNIPCIINNKVNTPEIPILEAMYNHNKSYTIQEMVDYIDYLEKQKGIMSASMIEYLLQMNSGDYTKLKDILNDDDEDIVNKLMQGIYTIEAAFKKLEQRRKKESAEEKDIRKAEKVYGDAEESGVDQIKGSGEQADEEVALTEDELKDLSLDSSNIDSGLDEKSLEDMVEESKSMDGFGDHKQDVHNREYVDPALKKAALQKDDYKCICCGFGEVGTASVLDFHHIIPVFLGGKDSLENSATLCLNCHHLVHEHSYGRLHIGNIEDMDENVQMQFKRIIRLGNIIRDGMAKKGMKVEQARKDHPVEKVGRRKPGTQQSII